MGVSVNFLLIAVLSYSTGSWSDGNPRGYQSAPMQRLESMEQCKIAAETLLETYKFGNIDAGNPTRGQIRCVDLTTKESIVVHQFGKP